MAFFFKDDTLLVPQDFPDTELDKGVSPDLAKDFSNPDIFEIPALSGTTAPPIQAVSVNELPKGWKGIGVRQFLTLSAIHTLCTNEIIRACHVVQWRKDSVFCGRCGTKNIDILNEVRRDCPSCGKSEFPRICPAVIIIITDDKNRILLAHNKKFREGVYSHISGFNEAGETLEETVVREIKEEVDIKVRDIVYIKSQSWPFPNSLMLGFKARYLSGTVKPDGTEIEDAGWFTKDNLPQLPGEGSLSRFLINCWLAGTL